MGGGGGVRGAKVRRVLEFYRASFGICSPYRVLCDGTLIQQALSHKIFLRDALQTLLCHVTSSNPTSRSTTSTKAFMAVTSCVVAELRSLGEDFSGAALLASRVFRVACRHSQRSPVPASECILDTLTSEEGSHLLLGSTDADLIRDVRAMREIAVPIVTIATSSLVLERPSPSTKQLAEGLERQKLLVTTKAPPPRLDRKTRALTLAAMKKTRKDARDCAQFRRKRVKGPNPLSVKRKQPKKKPKPEDDNYGRKSEAGNESGTPEPSPAEAAAEDRPRPQLVRKRGRRKPKSTTTDAAVAATPTEEESSMPSGRQRTRDEVDSADEAGDDDVDGAKPATTRKRKRKRRKRAR